MPRPAELKAPKGLSPRAAPLWRRLHDENEFSPDSEDLIERYLKSLDLADLLTAKAHEAGLTSADGHRALSAARDAMQTALKVLRATGLDRADQGAPRRPGRPSGDAWSPKRSEGARQWREMMRSGATKGTA